MNAMTLKDAKKELKQRPKPKEKIIREYTTGEGILIGKVACQLPDKTYYKQGMYQANILLSVEEGQHLTKELEQMQQRQYETVGEGTELTTITTIIEPYTTENKTLQGKYILRTQNLSQTWENVDVSKPFIKVTKELENKMLNGAAFPIKEGDVVSLTVRFETYTTSHSTGLIAVLKGVEIINPLNIYT